MSPTRPLIIGDADDPHVKAVARRVEADPVVVDASSLANRKFVLDGHGTTEIDDARIGGSGWIRRLSPPDWETGAVLGSRAAAEQTAWLSTLSAVCRTPHIAWLTPLETLYATENKLLQCQAANRLGVPTPRTLVTNDALTAAEQVGTSLIAKPLGPGIYREDGDLARKVFAEPLYLEDPAQRGFFSGPPFIVQQKLTARAHLRIVTVQQQAWGFSLDATDLPVDWRRSRSGHHSWRQSTTTTHSDHAVQLAEDLGVGYSSQDWIVTDDGTYFVDLNPAGQWLFLPEPGRDEISAAIAHHLDKLS